MPDMHSPSQAEADRANSKEEMAIAERTRILTVSGVVVDGEQENESCVALLFHQQDAKVARDVFLSSNVDLVCIWRRSGVNATAIHIYLHILVQVKIQM